MSIWLTELDALPMCYHSVLHREGMSAYRSLPLYSLYSLSPRQCDLIVLSWPASLWNPRPKPLPARAGPANDLLCSPGSRSPTIWTDAWERVRVSEVRNAAAYMWKRETVRLRNTFTCETEISFLFKCSTGTCAHIILYRRFKIEQLFCGKIKRLKDIHI